MTDDAEPKLIVATIEPHGDARWKVTWRQNGPFPPYTIDRKAMEGFSARAREALVALVQEVQNGGWDRCGAQLKGVAEQGVRLCETLFARGIPGDSAAGQEVRDWLEREIKDPQRIQFEVNDLVHVPWGLIFNGNPEDLPGVAEDSSVEAYHDFWCLKFHASAMHGAGFINRMNAALGPIAADSFRIHGLFHRSVLARAQEQLNAGERDALARLFPDTSRDYSWDSLINKNWKTMNDRDGMLYILCHADGSQFALDSGKAIDRLDLQDLTRKERIDRKTGCLAYINGCSTAAGAPTGGFLEATGRQGFLGFIGTEASIPDVFALRFGLAFVRELTSKRAPIYRVMARLRRRHWPLSLLYSLYCYPNLCLLP